MVTDRLNAAFSNAFALSLMPSASLVPDPGPLIPPGIEDEARHDFSRRERGRKRDPEQIASQLAMLRCQWLLTLKPAEAAAMPPTPAAALAELRAITKDDSLQCTLDRADGLMLSLDGSWSGYLRATKAAVENKLRTVCGCILMSIEPAFSPEYLKLYENVATRPTIIENFVQVYGPHFFAAVKYARSRYPGYWNLPAAEEILTAVWARCIAKLPVLVKKYSAIKGKQCNYLFIIAKNAAHDFIRPLVNDPIEPVAPEKIALPASRYRIQEILEKRDLVQKLLSAFEQLCGRLRERKKPGDWEFFREHFLNEVSKEEMCQRYSMTSNTFDMRVHRIRERLSEIMDDWLSRES